MDQQVRKLMEEITRHGQIGRAAMRSGMDRKTARRYLGLGLLPSEMNEDRNWRTRPDPLHAEDWAEVEGLLRDAPELEAKALFEYLSERTPGRYDPGQVRTLQRRIRVWRAQEGPGKEVFFPQEHRPGEAIQTDFTSGNELRITIRGVPFPHLICHPVLPFSNWEWATVCRSESMAALKRGVQEALFHLGRTPKFHQTDNSTAATHDVASGKRMFNQDYKDFVTHFGMEPRTIAIAASEQNGDVEALNRALKRRLVQHLLLRRSRDFESVKAYEDFIHEVLMRANRLRTRRVSEEMDAMKPIVVSRFPEYREITVRVTSWSTIRVQCNAYSVPSRLIGERVKVRIYDDRLEVIHGGVTQDTFERLAGRLGHKIHYRHVIDSLIRKPGAFALYRYREDLFPTVAYRRAYDALLSRLPEREANLEYLRILQLAARESEAEVTTFLEESLANGGTVSEKRLRERIAPETHTTPVLEPLLINLACYDALLSTEIAVAP